MLYWKIIFNFISFYKLHKNWAYVQLIKVSWYFNVETWNLITEFSEIIPNYSFKKLGTSKVVNGLEYGNEEHVSLD